MSMERKETITCPECGHTQDFIIWQTLNGDLDPEAKQQLLDGTLFRFECNKCGHKSNVDYGILYHDMMHQAMIYYVDENSVRYDRTRIVSYYKQTNLVYLYIKRRRRRNVAPLCLTNF